MANVALALFSMAIAAKYGELMRKEASSIKDAITVEQSLDVLGKAVEEVLAEIEKRQSLYEGKPQGEA